jgi:hypothetical protein
MSELRRSSRIVQRINYADDLTPSYPEGEPANNFEKIVANLDQESFDSKLFSSIDDILVYSLFGTKRHDRGY